MPNHWSTKLVFNKKDKEKVQEIFEREGYDICRDVIPRPEILDHTQSPSDGRYHVNNKDFMNNDVRPFTDEEKAELKKIGYDNWYDWCNNNWGTKWGTYDTMVKGNKVFFDSAWCSPTEKVFQLFANKYNLNFEVFGHDDGEDDYISLFSIEVEKE